MAALDPTNVEAGEENNQKDYHDVQPHEGVRTEGEVFQITAGECARHR